MRTLSPLQTERLKYEPKLPQCLADGINNLEMEEGKATESVRDQEAIKEQTEKNTADIVYLAMMMDVEL